MHWRCLVQKKVDVGGTGKTIALLSLIIAYISFYPITRKLIYCPRTVHEIEKTLEELKSLLNYRAAHGEPNSLLALGLASRKNLCIHPQVSQERWGKLVDVKCRNLTAPWLRGKMDGNGNVASCDFFDALENLDEHFSLTGVYTIQDIQLYGKKNGICPYFLVRKLLASADVIVYSYHYLLDPKVSDLVSKNLSKESIVVFDEAHNIGNKAL